MRTVADMNRCMYNMTDPGYLTDARDLETLQEGVHVASKMLDSQVCPCAGACVRGRHVWRFPFSPYQHTSRQVT